MLIFLFIVIIYSSANFYIFFKLSYILNLGMPIEIFLGLLVLFMTLSPILINLYSLKGSDKSVRVFAYIGYMWLAFLIPFFPIGVLFDFYNFITLHSNTLFKRDFSSIAINPVSTFLVSFFLSIAVNIYGYFEAKNLHIERLTVKTSKLPKGVDKITIAQIADLHLGIIVRDKALEKVIEKIENIKPDLIVSTGDLVDGTIRHIDHLADKLKRVQAQLGKFAVMGNHEIYGGARHTIKFIKDSGFTLLRGSGVVAENTINIAGMDFTGGEARRYDKDFQQKPEWEILSGLPGGLFTLLLKHRSDVENESLGLFDLQLSGHTHKGQIFPMNLATMFIFQHHTGFTRLAKGSAIYVSRGTGTAGPPIRFLSTPEIAIIDIVSTNITQSSG